MKHMNQNAVRFALFISIIFLLGQFFFRPLWRDEFWALYFSAPNDPFWISVSESMSKDVHPPLYFILLHFWRQISENEIFARFLNALLIGGAGWVSWKLRSQKNDETLLYLFLCATSFWLIFYAAEIRMMGGLFLISGVMVLIARNAVDDHEHALKWGGIFLIAATIAASSHFFGTLWTACLGAAIGLTHLYRGRLKPFFTFAFASILAICPALIWIMIFRPDQNPGAPEHLPPFMENLHFSVNQFLRGIVVKTLLANIMAFAAAMLGIAALLRNQTNDPPKTLILAIGLTITIAFSVHLGFVALIKERAFIVIIPAIFYTMSEAILSLKQHQTKALKAASWIPYAAIISLPLFTSEFFKDREHVGELKSLMASTKHCSGEPILAYLRPSDQAEDFSGFMTEALLDNAIRGGYDMIPLNKIIDGTRPLPDTQCEIKVIAIALLRGERDMHQNIREDIASAGLDLSQLTEIRMGKGRTRAWVSPGFATEQHKN